MVDRTGERDHFRNRRNCHLSFGGILFTLHWHVFFLCYCQAFSIYLRACVQSYPDVDYTPHVLQVGLSY